MANFSKNIDFTSDSFHISLLLNLMFVENFYGHLLIGLLVDAQTYFSKSPFSYGSGKRVVTNFILHLILTYNFNVSKIINL
jgi:hypothetical protein